MPAPSGHPTAPFDPPWLKPTVSFDPGGPSRRAGNGFDEELRRLLRSRLILVILAFGERDSDGPAIDPPVGAATARLTWPMVCGYLLVGTQLVGGG
jgi:hypothetical protein